MSEGNGSTALAVTVPQDTALAQSTTARLALMRQALAEASEQRAILKEYVGRHMVKDADYGVIPGTQKPTLLKPGAEKLLDLFRCTATYKVTRRTEDFVNGFFAYEFRCQIVSRDSGAVLAEGFGSANSKEGRYRWRDANRKCPGCGKEAIIKGRDEYGGGWLCFKKKGGCGAKFSDGDKSIESQAQGKVENDDICTLANTILKMGKKRALVDAAIALARCADLFTQDVEDFAGPVAPEDHQPAKRATEATRRVAHAAADSPDAPEADTPGALADPGPGEDGPDGVDISVADELCIEGDSIGSGDVDAFNAWVKKASAFKRTAASDDAAKLNAKTTELKGRMFSKVEASHA